MVCMSWMTDLDLNANGSFSCENRTEQNSILCFIAYLVSL
jgi:hypothetical protein